MERKDENEREELRKRYGDNEKKRCEERRWKLKDIRKEDFYIGWRKRNVGKNNKYGDGKYRGREGRSEGYLDVNSEEVNY